MLQTGTSTKAEDEYLMLLKLAISDKWKIFWYMDIEKAFDSLDHKFLISVLKKICIWSNLNVVDRNSFKKSTYMCH